MDEVIYEWLFCGSRYTYNYSAYLNLKQPRSSKTVSSAVLLSPND